MNIEYLKAAAAMVERQALDHPDIAIPVDPDVADFMGAFEDPVLDEADFDPLDDDEEAAL